MPCEPAWWRCAVVYQVWPRSFADSDGDGVGDLRGLIAHLDHLQDLGVDAVWVSPFYPSPQVDNGYDISDYCDVDPLFGSLDDVDALVAALHERGMRLVLDMVFNHTSDRHPWFTASRSSREDPRRDWYFWRDDPPNRWRSFFGGPAWRADPTTGSHYLASFAAQQPDLCWDTREVREALYDVLRFWLDRGVDGFRYDVVSLVSKDLGDTSRQGVMGFGPRWHDYLREMHDAVLAGRDLLTVGETPGITVEQARLVSEPERRELDMVFGFEHVSLDIGATKWTHVPLPLPRLKGCFAKWQHGVGSGWNSLYWDNHDQPRAVSRFGDDRDEHRVASAKTLATVLHLHRGTPYVYQGEELGMRNPRFASIDDYRDVESLNHYRAVVDKGGSAADAIADLQRMSRDNARTPMPWDAGPTGGFTTGTPWIRMAPDTATVNVAAQRGDDASVLAHYRRLVALRHREPVVVHGGFELLLPDDERVWAFRRRCGGQELLVVANCSGDDVVPDLPGWTAGELLVGTHEDAPPRLRPWESRVMRR